VQGRHTEFCGSESFRFACHEGLECFNRCCRDINIFLSPYDVLRMSRKLRLDTSTFLERYITKMTARGTGYPVVLLKMKYEDLACPFVTGTGCSIYSERPWSCRMAPVEIRGENRYGFAFESEHCRGLLEDREWTVSEWMENQANADYAELEREFAQIPEKLKFTGLPSLDKHIREMFYLACYDLDRFRRYVFDGSFINVFQVPEETVKSIKHDDLALLQFGFNWLSRGFDLRQSIKIRDEVFEG